MTHGTSGHAWSRERALPGGQTRGAPKAAPCRRGRPATWAALAVMLCAACSDEPASDTGADASGLPPSMPEAVDCTITSTLEMSPVIGTVGIVELTTDLPNVRKAHVEFGLETSYDMTAPVDLAEPGYRTLLLGMKASREYHYRVVVSNDAQVCTGLDNVLTTGALPTDRPNLVGLTVNTPRPDEVAGGFTITGIYPLGPAFIIDADGDYVWWFRTGDASRVRMSYDAKFMWIEKANVVGGSPLLTRVSMDGMDVEEFRLDSEFGDAHHDFVVLPDETIVFVAHDPGGCDAIMERAPDGQVHEIINSSTATGSDSCHVNSVHYSQVDDTITFSDLDPGSLVKVTRSGQVVWVLGGAASDFTGTGSVWHGGQHGHHLLSPERLLLFSNGELGASSMAYEITLDLDAMTAQQVWAYDGGESTPVFGDVFRLDNGNTLVVYTTAGTMHEIDAEQQLVQSMVWDAGGSITYVQRRHSLYGPPPRL